MRFKLVQIMVLRDEETDLREGIFEIPDEDFPIMGVKFGTFNEKYFEVIYLVAVDDSPDKAPQSNVALARSMAEAAASVLSMAMDSEDSG